jgi:hypothetical protein
MKCYLRIGDDYLTDAKRYRSKREACDVFREVAEDLGRFEQSVDGWIHYANNTDELQEYPDFFLSLGPRGGLHIERT